MIIQNKYRKKQLIVSYYTIHSLGDSDELLIYIPLKTMVQKYGIAGYESVSSIL